MSAWQLPTSVELGGREHAFRSDFRDVLEVVSAMSDPSIPEDERGLACLVKFYEDVDGIPASLRQDAADYMLWFVGGGGKPMPRRSAKVMDWEQDADMIAAPINRVLGYECRSCEYLHWWTFLAAYMEVGDCLFAQVVAIRDKQRRGKKLEKHEREFYARNRELVDMKVEQTEQEKAMVDEWIG